MKTNPLYRPDGPIDIIVQIRLTEVFSVVESFLKEKHNVGEMTVPDARKAATELVGRVELKAKTIGLISLE